MAQAIVRKIFSYVIIQKFNSFRFDIKFYLLILYTVQNMGPNWGFVHVDIQLFQHQLFKRQSFLYWTALHICQKSVVHLRVGLFPDFRFYAYSIFMAVSPFWLL